LGKPRRAMGEGKSLESEKETGAGGDLKKL